MPSLLNLQVLLLEQRSLGSVGPLGLESQPVNINVNLPPFIIPAKGSSVSMVHIQAPCFTKSSKLFENFVLAIVIKKIPQQVMIVHFAKTWHMYLEVHPAI